MTTHVYFVRNGKKNGAIKIGLARDVAKRISELQIGNPVELNLIASIPVKNRKEAEKLEKMLHKKFSNQNIRGEWFYGSIKLSKVFQAADL